MYRKLHYNYYWKDAITFYLTIPTEPFRSVGNNFESGKQYGYSIMRFRQFFGSETKFLMEGRLENGGVRVRQRCYDTCSE